VWERLLGWCRDPVSGFLGVVLAVIAIGWGVWSWRASQTEKSLSFGVVSQLPLVSVRDDANGRLKVQFDGKPRRDLYQVVVRVINSGNVPIESDDFKRPLMFDFQAPILSAGVAEATPPDLQPAIEAHSQRVTLKPLLLNQGDAITLKVIVASPGKHLVASARISGVRQVREIDFSAQGDHTSPSNAFLNGVCVGTLLLVLLNYFFDRRDLRRARDLVTKELEASRAKNSGLPNP
jgi:hypothetical protein